MNCRSALSHFQYSLKNHLKSYKNKAKKPIIKVAKSLPVSSRYVGLPKGFYASSKDYWNRYGTDRKQKITYTTFHEPSVIHRHPPKSIYKETHWKFSKEYFRETPETFAVTARNCRVLRTQGDVVTHDDKLLFDVSRKMGISDPKNHPIFQSFKLPPCQSLSKTVAVLSTDGSLGYFHWLMDAFPRLEIIKKVSPIGIEGIDKFIVTPGMPAIVESLEMLNIPLEKLFFADSKTHIQAETLVIPSLPGNTGNPPRWVCEFLRENLLKHKADIEPIRRLYISRSKAGRRKVINEEDVLEFLSSFSFTPVYLEEHSLSEQIALLSNAEFIVAPHGAGLTNLVWCRSGAKVLELFSPNYVNVCFWAISNQIGLDYFYLLGEIENPPKDYVDPNLCQDNILVSIEKLSMSLEILLN